MTGQTVHFRSPGSEKALAEKLERLEAILAGMGRTLVAVNSCSFKMSGSWTGSRIVAARPVAP